MRESTSGLSRRSACVDNGIINTWSRRGEDLDQSPIRIATHTDRYLSGIVS